MAANGDAERPGSPDSSFEVNGGINGRDDGKHPSSASPGRERELGADDLELIEGDFNDVIHVHVPEVPQRCTCGVPVVYLWCTCGVPCQSVLLHTAPVGQAGDLSAQ